MNERGILNKRQNNCFLSAILQSLYHLEVFRDTVAYNSLWHQHNDPEDSSICLSCSIREFFLEYADNNTRPLDPSIVRYALTQTNQLFTLKQKGCSTEALQEILLSFHRIFVSTPQLANSPDLDVKHSLNASLCNLQCIPHYVFGCEVECTQCLPSPEQFHMTIYVESLKAVHSAFQGFQCDWQLLLQQTLHCSGAHKFISTPRVVIFSLQWSKSSKSFLSTLLSLLSPTLNFSEIVNSSKPSDLYIFRGLIGYSFKHYVAYFHNKQSNSWTSFNDSSATHYSSWSKLKLWLNVQRRAPVLLFYESVHSSETTRSLHSAGFLPLDIGHMCS